MEPDSLTESEVPLVREPVELNGCVVVPLPNVSCTADVDAVALEDKLLLPNG